MNGAPARSGRRQGDRLGALLLAILIGWTVFLHHGFGPAPREQEPSWIHPAAFLLTLLRSGALAPLGDGVGMALLVFAGPAAALAAAVVASTRSALLRLLAVAAAIACGIFVYYGLGAPRVWSFFHWRWSAAIALFSLIAAGGLVAPMLVARLRRRSAALLALLYLPVFLALLALELNVTGTDPALRFSVSPWPVLQVTALQVVLPGLAVVMLAVASGLTLLRAARDRSGAARAALALLAAAAAAGLPAGALRGMVAAGALPAAANGAGLAALVGFATLAAVAAARPRERLGERAGIWAAAALLCALPVATGRVLARSDYATTRDVHAARMIDALEIYLTREGLYPERLEELVAAGLLPSVPRPRIGLPWLTARAFHYQSFGSSYLLEFDAPRWVQCAYNPPFQESDDEATAEDGAGSTAIDSIAAPLQGSWSCPSEPPELW